MRVENPTGQVNGEPQRDHELDREIGGLIDAFADEFKTPELASVMLRTELDGNQYDTTGEGHGGLHGWTFKYGDSVYSINNAVERYYSYGSETRNLTVRVLPQEMIETTESGSVRYPAGGWTTMSMKLERRLVESRTPDGIEYTPGNVINSKVEFFSPDVSIKTKRGREALTPIQAELKRFQGMKTS